jgi:gluconate 5-dehydrogenase
MMVTGARFAAGTKGVVLAASPIETARLLLASGIRHPFVGRQLTDHISTSYLLVDPFPGATRKGSTSAFIPRFVNTSRRTQRPYPGGFCIELRGNISGASLADNLIGLVRDRVDPRTASFTVISAMGEQLPHPDRFVDLAPRAVDAVGRPLPRIHRARLLPEEQRMLLDMRECCLAIADDLAGPNSFVARITDANVATPMFHPASSCAMGDDDASPCDSWGRFRSLENVWIADASALPTAGDCHPTLTVLAHAMRVCESVRGALG